MRIFLSAGEPSGDLHAANLARALRSLRPDVEIVGFGGDHMEKAGVSLLFRLTDLAVMWFGRVLLNLHKFFEQADRADIFFRDQKPDVLILVDYPGFHFALAKRAHARGIPVVWYVPPQLWAWAGWRVEKVRKWVDHVLCSLPFEPQWYRDRGVPNAAFLGHPYFDELADRPLDDAFLAHHRERGGPVIALLAGSRTQEVKRNLPMMLRAAAKVAQSRPETRFLVASLHDRHAKLAREIAEGSGIRLDRLEVLSGKTAEIIRLAHVAWSVSGSVGLELMVEALPTVVVYKVRDFDLLVARQFIKSKYISLVNLLADDEVMPEYLTPRDVSSEMAGWALKWLNDPAERARASKVLADLRDKVAIPGASSRAAERIVQILDGTYRGPHRSIGSKAAQEAVEGRN